MFQQKKKKDSFVSRLIRAVDLNSGSSVIMSTGVREDSAARSQTCTSTSTSLLKANRSW